MSLVARTPIRLLIAGLAGVVLAVVAGSPANASPPAAPTFSTNDGGAFPLRIPTSGGTTVYLYDLGGVLPGATATFTPAIGSPVSGLPLVQQPDTETTNTFTVTAPPMAAGAVRITLTNTVGGVDSAPNPGNFRTVTYGDNTVNLSFTCTESSVALLANVGDYVKLIPTGACLDPVYYPGSAGWTGAGAAPPTYGAGMNSNYWGYGAMGNLNSPPARGPGYTFPWGIAVHPLAAAGTYSQTLPTTDAEAGQSIGQWQAVVGSPNDGMRYFYSPGSVAQVTPGVAVDDTVAYLYFYIGDYQYASTIRQIPIVYAGGRVDPPTPPGPSPPPAPAMSPMAQTLLGTAGEQVKPTAPFALENFTLVPRYGMYPELPEGLSMDPATGIVSGTPAAAYPSTRHWITATAGGNAESAYATLQIEVKAAPTPPVPPVPTLVITGSRGVEDARVVRVSGVATELAGERVTPWFRRSGQGAFVAGKAGPMVAADGSFAWQRRSGRAIDVYFTHGSTTSNTVTIAGR